MNLACFLPTKHWKFLPSRLLRKNVLYRLVSIATVLRMSAPYTSGIYAKESNYHNSLHDDLRQRTVSLLKTERALPFLKVTLVQRGVSGMARPYIRLLIRETCVTLPRAGIPSVYSFNLCETTSTQRPTLQKARIGPTCQFRLETRGYIQSSSWPSTTILLRTLKTIIFGPPTA